ncbi:ABC transporter permease [Micromonospora globispora]|nr:ABC transporter permease [Micromonospora globispora]RQW91888.1 ABC transporter permease [Micromonospora globispora]
MLPSAAQVLADTVGLFGNTEFLLDVVATMEAWAIGLAIATAIGVPLGLVLGSLRVAYEVSSVVVEFLRPIPSVALIPLAILLFGQGTEMKASLAIYASVWPIFFNTLYGVRDVNPISKETARTFRLTPFAILRRVALPHAAPFILTGVRISAAIALIVTISAELLAGSSAGIGAYVLRISSGGGSTSMVFAGTVVAGVLGVLVNSVLQAAERRLFPWKHVEKAA